MWPLVVDSKVRVTDDGKAALSLQMMEKAY